MSLIENPGWMFVLHRLYRNGLVMEDEELREEVFDRSDHLKDRWNSEGVNLFTMDDIPDLYKSETRYREALAHLEAVGVIEILGETEWDSNQEREVRITELGLKIVHDTDLHHKKIRERDRRKQRENRLTAQAGYMTVILALATASPGLIYAFNTAEISPLFTMTIAFMMVLAPILLMSDIVKGKVLNQWR